MDYYEHLTFKIGSYSREPMVMAISMYDEGERCGEITKNFGNYMGDPFTGAFVRKNCAFIDANNYPDIEEYVESLGAKPYKRFGCPVSITSGFCTYPLYEFPEEVLKLLDEEGYKKYSQGYDKALPKEQSKLNKRSFG